MSIEKNSVVEFVAFPTIQKERLKAYSDASGDFNAIHLDEEVAKKVGLPGIIAHGMLIAAFISERAVQFVKQNPDLKDYQLVQFQYRFKAMTLLGDTPSVGGTVKEFEEGKLVLELQAKNQRGETTTTAVARFSRV